MTWANYENRSVTIESILRENTWLTIRLAFMAPPFPDEKPFSDWFKIIYKVMVLVLQNP
jgi:hypothetical protein